MFQSQSLLYLSDKIRYRALYLINTTTTVIETCINTQKDTYSLILSTVATGLTCEQVIETLSLFFLPTDLQTSSEYG